MSYKPIFHMPIIAPPPAGSSGTPTDYYSGLHVTASATQLASRQEMEIAVSDATHATVYAACGGVVSFIPAGNTIPSPDNQIAPAGGALVLKSWADDFIKHKRSAPEILPAASHIYFNVEVLASQIKAAVATVKHRALKKFWKQHNQPPIPDDKTLRDFYQDGVMKGLAWVFVDGGTPLGKAIASSPAQEAKFRLQRLSGDGLQAYLSPIDTIQIPPRIDPSLPSGRWEGHPMLAAVAKFPSLAEFHLKFTIWNPMAKVKDYSPIDNAVVRLMHTSASGDKAIADAKTNKSGVVSLSYPNIKKLSRGERMLHFEIDLQDSKLHYDRKANKLTEFPMPFWSTKNWRSADGVYNLSEKDFPGGSVGTAAAPVEFRVGLDFHVRFRREDSISCIKVQFPQHSHVQVSTRDGKSDAVDFVTDATGAIDGVIYDVDPLDEVTFDVRYASIRLAGGMVDRRAYFESVADLHKIPEVWIAGYPCLAGVDPSHLTYIDITNDIQSDAIYILQCFEEACALVAYLSPPSLKLIWNDEDGNPIKKGLKLSFWNIDPSETDADFHGDGSVEWKEIYIQYFREWQNDDRGLSKSDLRDSGIFHELGHAVNKLLTVTSSEALILMEKFAPLENQKHSADTKSNIYFAFSEGFAAFFSALFTGYHSAFSRPLYRNGQAQADLDTMLSDFVKLLPEKKGDIFEGAFAASLYLIVNSHVAQRKAIDKPVSLVRTSGDCEVVKANAWLKESGVLDRFQNMIWKPFMSLDKAPDTTDQFVDAVRTGNSDQTWKELKATFNKLHIAVD